MDPEKEQEVGGDLYAFEGGDYEIVEVVQQEMASTSSEIEEIDSDDEDPKAVPPSLNEMIDMCWVLEDNSMVVCTEGVLELIKALHQYQGHLQKMRQAGEKQTMLDTFFH